MPLSTSYAPSIINAKYDLFALEDRPLMEESRCDRSTSYTPNTNDVRYDVFALEHSLGWGVVANVRASASEAECKRRWSFVYVARGEDF